jgi:GntR family transcriptional regulator / MocR family aminotransferase
MLPFDNMITLDQESSTPLFQQIAFSLSQLIREGKLARGSRLPGSRILAQQLGVHRKTIVAALEELEAQGWLESVASVGTFVSQKLPEIKVKSLGETTQIKTPKKNPAYDFQADPQLQKPLISNHQGLRFDDGLPDVRLAPLDSLARYYRQRLLLGQKRQSLGYASTQGDWGLRQALCNYLRESRGLCLNEDNIMITRGSIQAFHLASNCLLKPGSVVGVGDIGYFTGRLIFAQTGATLQGFKVDQHGLDPNAVEDWCKKMPLRMLYLTPHHHYPTTVSMPAGRRLELLELARRYRFCILEDDYDFDFHYDTNPVLPLSSEDNHGSTLYVGSFCKAISPALRLGYAIGPSEVIGAMSNLRRIVDRQGEQVFEAAFADFLKDGELRRHLKKAVKTYEKRRNTLAEMLKSELGDYLNFEVPTGGMAIWGQFDSTISLIDLAQKASALGMNINNGSNYHWQEVPVNAARLGFASIDETEMEQGLGVLKKLIKNKLRNGGRS